MKLEDRIESILHVRPERIRPLHGGMIGKVYRVDLPGQAPIVAKVSHGNNATLDIEGYMLRYLAEHSEFPVPHVLHDEPALLLMTFLEGDSHLSAAVQRHAGELVAALHEVRGARFGLERDTLIGPLHQPNPWSDSWVEFFRDQRLLYMARETKKGGALPVAMLKRIERLAGRLDRWLQEPEHPSLIHGDLWTTNMLAVDGRISGFIDPALYYGHAEMELAYTTLFGTFSTPFFDSYQEFRPIAPGFFEERRDIYNLYPLLVHVRIFGGGYVASVDSILRKFGV